MNVDELLLFIFSGWGRVEQFDWNKLKDLPEQMEKGSFVVIKEGKLFNCIYPLKESIDTSMKVIKLRHG